MGNIEELHCYRFDLMLKDPEGEIYHSENYHYAYNEEQAFHILWRSLAYEHFVHLNSVEMDY